MKNQDELLHSVRTNLSVQEILSASESEINAEEKDSLDEDELEFANRDETVEDADTEFNAVDTAPHLKPPIGKRGDVNELHAEYVATKTATDGSLRSQLEIQRKRDELLADVSNLALRFFASQEFQDSLEGIVGEDVAQDVVVKVLQKVDTFEFKSKFSTWVYRIYENCVRDAVRVATTRGESPLEEDAYHGEVSGRRATATALDGPSLDDESDESDEAAAGNGRQPQYAPTVLFAEENARINMLSLQQAVGSLKPLDRKIATLMFLESQDDKEIMKRFGWTFVKTRNKRNRLLETIEHNCRHTSVRLHTCFATTAQDVEPKINYVSVGGIRKSLKRICRCEKYVTRLEARRLVELGEVQRVLKLDEKNRLITDRKNVWSSQSVRVPRIGLTATTAEGLRRAYLDGNKHIQRDIEISHRITLQERAKLIVYEDDLKARGIDPHHWDGRAVMMNYSAKREESRSLAVDALPLGIIKPFAELLRVREDGLVTVRLENGVIWSGIQSERVRLRHDSSLPPRQETRLVLPKKRWEPPPPSLHQPEKPTKIESQEGCPRCREEDTWGLLTVSAYLDGSSRHDCTCGYLLVFKKKTTGVSKVASSLVRVVKTPIPIVSSAISVALPS